MVALPAGVRRLLSILLKLGVAAVVIGIVVYQLRFAPVPVDGYSVAYGPITSEVMGTGTLEARVSASISPKISGLVTQVLADQGERIAKGQLLAALDDGATKVRKRRTALKEESHVLVDRLSERQSRVVSDGGPGEVCEVRNVHELR